MNLRRPLTVAELGLVCAAFADHTYKSGLSERTIRAHDLAAMTGTLAMTGMRPAEYWQRGNATWEPRLGHVWVHGTKTAAARRPTFPITETIRPVCGEQFYRRAGRSRARPQDRPTSISAPTCCPSWLRTGPRWRRGWRRNERPLENQHHLLSTGRARQPETATSPATTEVIGSP
jgi:integrase